MRVSGSMTLTAMPFDRASIRYSIFGCGGIGSESHALSCHIAIADIPMSASNKILVDVKEKLHDEFHIIHTTIQFEHAECEVAHGCVMPVGDGHVH